MKPRTSRLGLSILAGGMSFVGSANAVDLIVNGSFENANGGEWKYYQTYNYTAQYFTGSLIPPSENPGSVYSWRHASANGAWTSFVTPTNETDHLTYNLQFANSQTVQLTNAITGAAVDAGLGRYSFSSWLASYGQPGSNPEQPYVVLKFLDAAGTAQVGSYVIFDRTTNYHAVMFADGNTSVPEDVSGDHSMIKYAASGVVPAGARQATVYITRSPNATISNSPDTYVDLVKLDVYNINDTSVLDSASPVNGQQAVSPDAKIQIVLKDIANQVDTNSIHLSFDGVAVSPTIEKSGALTTIHYTPVGLLLPLTTHTTQIAWSDSGGTPTTKTNQLTFSVVAYANIQLGTPLYLETFDTLAEGALPTGWSVQNFTDLDTVPGIDFNNFHSDAFLDWAVISRSTLSNWFTVTPGGGDFPSMLNVAPNQVINTAVVTNLIENNFIVAVSDRASGQKQIQYLFTGDYDLSGKTNIYLAFNSIWTQNQDSLAAVEYSTDGGTTWLPAQYLLDTPDILRTATGNIDASNTFATVYSDVPDQINNTTGNGYYGQFIGVAQSQWAGLGAFLSGRVDDNQTSSKRVEILRLTQADNKPAVRFRFAAIGTWSWYWGIDNFALYSIPAGSSPPIMASGPTPPAPTVAIGNSLSISLPAATGLAPLSYQWRHNGTNLPGRTDTILLIPNVSAADAGSYDVVVSNPGGTSTSPPPAAVVSVINPTVLVSGQWNFDDGLKAFVGRDLEPYDATVTADTTFGTTATIGILDINGQPASVMHYSPSQPNWGGYRMSHGAAPNGGGAYVNQYTLICDLYLPYAAWRSLLQTSLGNNTDGDVFIDPSGGLGISSVYNGAITEGQWHRVAFAFDLTGPGSPVLTKFVDGVKVGHQTTGLSGRDGRFALDVQALLFADNDGDNAEVYVSSVQFSNGRRPDAFIAALGGPSAAKIPGAIKAITVNNHTEIHWTGGVPLQRADSLAGPWEVVGGAASPYSPPAGIVTKFYRPKIP